MKQLIFTMIALAFSTLAFAAKPNDSVDTTIDRLVSCSVYHQQVYPLYSSAYINASALLHHKNAMGILDLNDRKELIGTEAKRFAELKLDAKGTTLIQCQKFLGDIIANEDLLKYNERLQKINK